MSKKDFKLEEFRNALKLKNNLAYNMLLSVGMFDWGNFGKEVIQKPNIFEMWLARCGSVAFQKQGDKNLFAPYPNRTGDLDQFDQATTITANVQGGNGTITGKEKENVFVIYNTDIMTGDLDIYETSETQAEIEKSKLFNIKWAMVAPIIRCCDSRQKAQLEEIIKNIFEGKLENVVSENVISNLISGENNDLTPIFLTQPEQIKNVQYLSELFDFESRKLYCKYGMNVQTTAKHAQTNNAEIHGYDSISWMLPLNKMKKRNEFVTWYNEKFGTNYEPVKFSEPWATEYEKYMSKQEETEETESEVVENENDENENT